MNRPLFIFAALFAITFQPARAQSLIQSESTVDYKAIAFYPDRWMAQGFKTPLHVWKGERIAFLSKTDALDPKVITPFIRELDRGWALYAEITGAAPKVNKLAAGLPTIVAVPGPRLDIRPSDQPVMYASAMLKLRKALGDDWLSAFFRQLSACEAPAGKPAKRSQAQCFLWYLAASCAAEKDLAAFFVDAWRFKPTAKQQAILDRVDWKASPKAAALLR